VTVEALSAALSAEHAAVYGYGVVGAHLDAAGKAAAADAENVHRNRRDALILRLTQEKVTPPAAAAAYALPFQVTDRVTALKLAVALEAGAAVAWRSALGGTIGDDRAMALNALIDCAMRATQWRVTAGITPATVPFPGTPA
jgi:Domain of unknown function (DUF4439)